MGELRLIDDYLKDFAEYISQKTLVKKHAKKLMKASDAIKSFVEAGGFDDDQDRLEYEKKWLELLEMNEKLQNDMMEAYITSIGSRINWQRTIRAAKSLQDLWDVTVRWHFGYKRYPQAGCGR